MEIKSRPALQNLILSSRSDAIIDRSLGLRVDATENMLSFASLALEYPDERIGFGDFPYKTLWELVEQLQHFGATSLLDLGSGYGRLCLLASLAGIRKVWGIELIQTRCREARRAAKALGLHDCRFRCADVNQTQWPKVTAYALMNSLFEDPRRRLIKRLCRRICQGDLVGSISLSNAQLDKAPWLELVFRSDPDDPLSLSLYQAYK